MNVGELVDQLMGTTTTGEVDFEKEVISADATVAVILPDGTIVDIQKIEYESNEDGLIGGTLWLRGDYL
jgi:hypothetical protein